MKPGRPGPKSASLTVVGRLLCRNVTCWNDASQTAAIRDNTDT